MQKTLRILIAAGILFISLCAQNISANAHTHGTHLTSDNRCCDYTAGHHDDSSELIILKQIPSIPALPVFFLLAVSFFLYFSPYQELLQSNPLKALLTGVLQLE